MSLSGLFNIDEWNFATQEFLSSISKDDYDFLITNREKLEYKKGEILLHQHTMLEGFYYIHKGKVKKYKTFHEHEQILYLAGKGEMVGYHAVLSNRKSAGSAATLEDCLVSFIPNEDLFELMNNSPAFNRAIITLLSREFEVYANYELLFAQGNAAERVAMALIYVREKFKEGDTKTDNLVINMTRMDLAKLVGLTKATTIRTLADFKENRVIKTRGSKIWVINLKKLAELTGRNLLE